MSRIRTNQRHIKDIIQQESAMHWRKIASKVLFAAILLSTIGAATWSLNQNLVIQHWRIVAAAPLKADIDNVLNNLGELDFWNSRPAHLHDEILSKVPDLADVYIQRQLPSTLVIHVKPRQATALWFNQAATDQQGELYLVDEYGIAYRARKNGESSNLPVLRMQQKDLAEACQWLSLLRKEQPEWFARSSELFALHDGWKLNLAAGQQWYIPQGTRGLQTITQLSNILKQPRWHTGNWRIDTRLKNRWFIRPATHEGII